MRQSHKTVLLWITLIFAFVVIWQFLNGQRVPEIFSVSRLAGDLVGTHRETAGVGADRVLESFNLRRQLIVALINVHRVGCDDASPGRLSAPKRASVSG